MGCRRIVQKIKSRLEIENFIGKSSLAINQDFCAKIFSCNLTAILIYGTNQAMKRVCEKRKRKYKVNFTQALNRMKNSIVLLFCRQQKIVMEYLNELAFLFASNLEIVRDHRSFHRNFRKSKSIFPIAYKSAF